MRIIVVGVEGGAEVEPALDFALDEAVRRGLPLEAVHAYPVPLYGEFPPALFPERLRAAREQAENRVVSALARARERVPGSDRVSARTRVIESDPTSALLAAADSAALLVVGCRGGNAFVRGVLGSVSGACLHRSRAPVAVVPNVRPTAYLGRQSSRVMVGFDGSPAALTALSWATAQAREWGCALTAVVVAPSADRFPPALRCRVQGPRSDVRAAVKQQVAEAGGADLEVHVCLLIGQAAEQFLVVLRPTDLLVIGSRGHAALTSFLLRSTSVSVAERAPCPVVVVRAGQARREIHQRLRHSSEQ